MKEGWKQSLSDIVPVQVKNKYPSKKKIEDEAEKVRRMLFLRGSERIFHWPKIEAKPEKKVRRILLLCTASNNNQKSSENIEGTQHVWKKESTSYNSIEAPNISSGKITFQAASTDLKVF